MSLNMLYPDSRSEQLDLEEKVFGAGTTLLNPRKKSFEEIDLAAGNISCKIFRQSARLAGCRYGYGADRG